MSTTVMTSGLDSTSSKTGHTGSPAMCGGSLSGISPQSVSTMKSAQFRLVDTDIHGIAQAVAQMIDHSSALQTHTNPIIVGRSKEGTLHTLQTLVALVTKLCIHGAHLCSRRSLLSR